MFNQPAKCEWSRSRRTALRAVAAAALLWTLWAAGQPAVSREYQVKAVFLYNFIQYVDWPASAFTSTESSFVIGILGDDPFGSFLDQAVAGESVHGRRVTVRRGRTVRELADCQVLFVSRSERSRQAEIITATERRPVLTVSDFEGLARRGAVLNFILENGQVRFEVNLRAANQAGLKLSSHLLKLARIVER